MHGGRRQRDTEPRGTFQQKTGRGHCGIRRTSLRGIRRGPRETLEFSPGDKHELRLLRRLRRQGVPTVAVFLSGRPLWVNPEINASDAFVAAWLPGSEGEGIADVLFRGADGAPPYDFTGRLSFLLAADGDAGDALMRRETCPARCSRAERASTTGARQMLPQLAGGCREFRASGEHPRVVYSTPATSSLPGRCSWPMRAREVHVTTARQQSPNGALAVALEPEGAAATWSGSQRGIAARIRTRFEFNSQAIQGGAISVRYRVDRAPEQNVKLGMRCAEALCGAPPGGASLDVTRAFRSAPLGAWQTLSVPLACLTAAGARSQGCGGAVCSRNRRPLWRGDCRHFC